MRLGFVAWGVGAITHEEFRRRFDMLHAIRERSMKLWVERMRARAARWDRYYARRVKIFETRRREAAARANAANAPARGGARAAAAGAH